MEITARTIATSIAVIGALGAVAGCGSSSSSTPKTVDDATVESGIKQQLSTSSNPVTSVKCPSDVESKPGATFQCSVTWQNGATGKVKVTETTVNHFTYVPVSGSVMVPGSVVEKSLQEDLAKQGAPNATVNCPDNIIVKVGTTVTCDLSGANGAATGTVTYSFSTVDGTVDSSSVKTSSG